MKLRVPSLGDLDQATQWAAVKISRRALVGGAVGATVALAAGSWLEPIVARADYCSNNCNSPCSNCYTQTGCCCSPDGGNCWCYASCSCSPCSSCGCFYAWQWICDSGAHSNGCSYLCWC